MRFVALFFALAAAVMVGIGAGLVYLPAGLIVGGFECAGGAYMALEYAKAREMVKARPR